MSVMAAISAAGSLGSGIATGVYAMFSLRVMPRLAGRPDAEAIATMQSFNRTAERAPFLSVFFGTAVASLAAIVRAAGSAERTMGDAASAAGGGLYLAGFLLTIAYNVPRNNALAAVEPASAEGARIWAAYLREWTGANSARAILSAGGAVALAAGTVLHLLNRG